MAQITIDDKTSLTTPQAMMQAIDSNFTELYSNTGTETIIDSLADLKALDGINTLAVMNTNINVNEDLSLYDLSGVTIRIKAGKTFTLATPSLTYEMNFIIEDGGKIRAVTNSNITGNIICLGGTSGIPALNAPVSTINLGINGTLSAGLYQIVDTVTLTGNPKITTVYPEWWGAVGDGVTDDTVAINKAIDVLSSGGVVTFRSATYLISDAIKILNSGITIQGTGQYTSIIKTSSTTANIIEVGSYTTNVEHCEILNLRVTSSVVKTSGAGVKVMNAHNIKIKKIRCAANMYIGIQFEGGSYGNGQFLYFLEDFEINTGTYGIIIGADEGGTPGYGSSALVQDIWISNGIIDGCTNSGIALKHLSGLYISSVDVITCKNGISIVPDSSTRKVVAVFASKVLGDTCTGSGWLVQPSNSGKISDLNLTDCWGSTNALHGMLFLNELNASDSSILSSISLVAPRCINNGRNGITIIGYVKDIEIINAQCLSNSTSSSGAYNGLTVGLNVRGLTVTNGIFGKNNHLGSNLQGYGISLLRENIDEYTLIGCNCLNNVTGSLYNAATGTTYTISSVRGYRTKNEGTAELLAGETSVTITHGLGKAPVNHNLTITNLVPPDWAGLSNSDAFWISDVSSTTFTISCSSAPTSSMWIGWTADISGR